MNFRFDTRTAVLLSLVWTVVVVGGCGSESVAAGPASPPGPAPVSKALTQRFEAATAGLIYDLDRVVVDPEWVPEQIGETSARELMAIADQARKDRRRLVALRASTDAVLAAPWMPESYRGLGDDLRSIRLFGRAAAAFLTALEIDPASNETRFSAANALQNAGRIERAVEELTNVITADPSHAEAHSRLASGLFLLGENDRAGDHLRTAVENGAVVPTHLETLLNEGTFRAATIIEGRPAGKRGPDGREPVIGEQVRIDTGGTSQANETTIAASDATSNEVVAGWNDWRQGGVRAGVSVSLDGGETWSDQLLRPPPGHTSNTEGDPMTAADHRTGTLWAGGVSYYVSDGGLYVARKQPGSTTFETAVMAYPTSTFVDKGWMGTGSRPGVPDSTRLFLAYHPFLQYSDDLGDSWSTPVDLDPGFGHLPRVSPTGELYIGYWDVNYGINIQRSLDGGDTVSTPIQIATRVDTDTTGSSYPGGFRVWPFTYIAVHRTTGTLYAVWHDVTGVVDGNDNVDLLFSRSTDQGTTWGPAVVINGDGDPPGDQFYPWLEIDQWGHLHMMFLDTRNTAQDDTDPQGWIDAYYSTSEDEGQTWTEHRLTPAPFAVGNEFFGDYCGLTVASDRVYPVYPSTVNGDLDIFSHRIIIAAPRLFFDGFESGDTSGWSIAVGEAKRRPSFP